MAVKSIQNVHSSVKIYNMSYWKLIPHHTIPSRSFSQHLRLDIRLTLHITNKTITHQSSNNNQLYTKKKAFRLLTFFFF